MKAILLACALSLQAAPVTKSEECRLILDSRNPNWMDIEHGVQFDFELSNLADREGWADCHKIIEEALTRAIKRAHGHHK